MSKRVPKEFLGAFKKGHRKVVREFIDEELAIKLLEKVQQGCKTSRKALEWLTKFNNEYYKDVINKNSALHKNQIIPGEFDKKGKPLTFDKECEQRISRARKDIFPRLNKFKNQGDEF